MSVLITDMDMPKNCFCCPLDHGVWKRERNPYICCRYTRGAVYYYDVPYDRRLPCCGLHEVHTPHGKLGDLDALVVFLENNSRALTVFDAINEIERMPTIIPAEKEEGPIITKASPASMGVYEPKPVTNADRLFRNASDEDLACFAVHAGCPYKFGADISFECKLGEVKDGCKGCWHDWLRQEAKEEK